MASRHRSDGTLVVTAGNGNNGRERSSRRRRGLPSPLRRNGEPRPTHERFARAEDRGDARAALLAFCAAFNEVLPAVQHIYECEDNPFLSVRDELVGSPEASS